VSPPSPSEEAVQEDCVRDCGRVTDPLYINTMCYDLGVLTVKNEYFTAIILLLLIMTLIVLRYVSWKDEQRIRQLRQELYREIQLNRQMLAGWYKPTFSTSPTSIS
jgi:hypothetical protein